MRWLGSGGDGKQSHLPRNETHFAAAAAAAEEPEHHPDPSSEEPKKETVMDLRSNPLLLKLTALPAALDSSQQSSGTYLL